MVFPLCMCLHLLLQGYQSHWIGAHSCDLINRSLKIFYPNRSHFEVMGVRTSAYGFVEGAVQGIILCFCGGAPILGMRGPAETRVWVSDPAADDQHLAWNPLPALSPFCGLAKCAHPSGSNSDVSSSNYLSFWDHLVLFYRC